MNTHLSQDQLISYVCRTLADAQRETMDIHLGTCQDCRARLAGYEALDRRLRYSVMDWRRGGRMSSGATFAAIAPRLRRARRAARFWTGAKQFGYGAATLLVLVILGIGLALFLRGIHPPIPTLQSPAPGTYVKTITLEDTGADDSMKYTSRRGFFPGEWQLTLGEGNRYTYLIIQDEKWPAVTEEGHYTLTPDQMVFTAEEGSCPRAGEGVATYQWAMDGDTLTMTATEQEDPCLYRRFVFTTHSWSKVGYELPPGVYSIAVVEADIPAAVPDDLRAALPGLWELEILEGEHFSLAHAGVSVSRGRYQLTRELMTLTADQGECTGLGEGGIYQWAFDGQALSLTAVQDWCDKRNAIFTLRPLTRSEVPKAAAEPEAAATPPLTITLESLAGLWQDAESGVYLRLDADGTFRLASSVAWLEASPLDVGRFRLEGALLTFSTFSYSIDSQWCVHQQGSYHVELTQPGELRFELQEDPCQSRASKLPAGRWGRVEP
jgi:hypothetical protein